MRSTLTVTLLKNNSLKLIRWPLKLFDEVFLNSSLLITTILTDSWIRYSSFLHSACTFPATVILRYWFPQNMWETSSQETDVHSAVSNVPPACCAGCYTKALCTNNLIFLLHLSHRKKKNLYHYKFWQGTFWRTLWPPLQNISLQSRLVTTLWTGLVWLELAVKYFCLTAEDT